MKVRGYRVFYIDRDKGVNDLINLLKETRTQKIALVIDTRQLMLNSPVNLELIKKYSERYNKQVVFVNPDPLILEKIRQIGFKTFLDLNDLEKDLPSMEIAAVNEGEDSMDEDSIINNTDTKKRNYFSRIAAVLLIFLIFLTAYFYFLYPTAVVTIRPVIKEVKEQLQFYGSTTITSIDWDNKIIPLHQVDVDISDQKEILTSGAKMVGEISAEGMTRFINENDKDVTIPSGTIVCTDDGLEFKTLDNITIPKLEVDYLMDVPVGMRAGQADVKVHAVKKGTQSNVGIGRIKEMKRIIDKVHVINPEPTRGGKDQRISIVTAEDQEKLQKELKDELKDKLLAKVYQELGGNYRVITDKLSYSSPVISFNQQVGEVSDKLTASAKLKATVYVIKNSELDRLSTRFFQNKLSDNVQLMSTGVTIKNLMLEDGENKLYNIKIEVLAPVIPRIDANQLTKSLQGLNLKEAGLLLDGQQDIEDYRIEARSNNMPRLGFAIRVVVSEPEAYKVFKVQD